MNEASDKVKLSLAQRDQLTIWHPFTQMQTAKPPFAITRAEGLYLYDDEGNRYMDAVSSWWVNLHGHCHPYLTQKILSQLVQLEHVIFAGFTHEPAIILAERLLEVLPRNQSRIFFSDNGSTAVEVAIKMSLQYWYNKDISRKKIIALCDSYHGDTFGSMAVSSPSVFTSPFRDLLFRVEFVEIPLTSADFERFRTRLSADVAAFIFEPLIQGSGGMKMHTPEVLNEMISICRQKGVLTIADEVMTGFGRTGKLFAVDYLIEKPDIMCLSKGLTGGTMPMGVTSSSNEIYEAFLSNEQSKTFFHGHSYTANPLACSAAIASLELLLKRSTQESIFMITQMHETFMEEIKTHPKVKNCRCRGTIIAIEWETEAGSSYFNDIRERLYAFFLKEGILLRPLGNTIYIMPPYCITSTELLYIYEKIKEALDKFH